MKFGSEKKAIDENNVCLKKNESCKSVFKKRRKNKKLVIILEKFHEKPHNYNIYNNNFKVFI